MTKKEDREYKEKLQTELTLKNLGINFLPGDNICMKCNKNILDGYTEEECSTIIITSCRNCNYSLVD